MIGGLSGIAARSSELSTGTRVLFGLALTALGAGSLIGLSVAYPKLVPEVLDAEGLGKGLEPEEWGHSADDHLKRASRARVRIIKNARGVNKSKARRLRIGVWFTGAGIILLLAAAVVALWVGPSEAVSPSDVLSPSPTASPTDVPSPSPTASPTVASSTVKVVAVDSEFLGLPLAAWNVFAGLLLVAITAVYVILTRAIAKGSQAAASAAVASLDIELLARFFAPMEEVAEARIYGGIVEIRNKGATIHIHEANVVEFWGEGSGGDAWERAFALKRVDAAWGPPPWRVHKGEHRTFFWPVERSHPGPGTILVTIAVKYSVGAGGEQATVSVPLDLSRVTEA